MANLESETRPEVEAADEKPINICRYLGLKQDRATYYLFESNSNYCHRPATPAPVALEYQRQFCLHEDHAGCPIFQEDWDGAIPRKVREDTKVKKKKSTRKKRTVIISWLVVTIACMALVGMIGYRGRGVRGRTRLLVNQVLFVIQNGRLRPTRLPFTTSTPLPSTTPTNAPTRTPTPSPLPSFTPLPQGTQSEVVFPSATALPSPFPTPGPGLGTPFGPESMFLIHVVASGESYTSIGQNFGTAPEVLRAVNPTLEGVSLWVGRQIVVPIGVQELGDLPPFEITYTQEALNLLALADFYDSDPEQIRFYNRLGSAEQVPSGRWLIIPLSP